MKKIICIALCACLFLIGNSCHDEVENDAELSLKSGKLKKDVVDEVKLWFESNPDANKFVLLKSENEVNWASTQVMEINNSIIIEVRMKLKGKYKVMSQKDQVLNFDCRLLFIKENGAINSYMEYFISKKDLAYLQDPEKVNYMQRDGSFEGTIVLEKSENESSIIYQSTGSSEELRLKNVAPTCYVLVEYFSDGSSRVVANLGCNGGGGDGSSGSAPSGSAGGSHPNPDPLPEPVPLPAPQYPIISIQEYLKCINAGLAATVTIYVDQPVPNSSQPASLSGTAGHAYIGISQGGNYSTFGFYPKTDAKISAKADYSALGDDSHRAYDVSVSKTVTSAQLQAVLSLTKNPPSVYNLDTYNCTDFALAIGILCGMNLPDTQSTWPGGGGSCPGALGQDIRNMTLPTGMSKNTSGGTPPSNLQNCP
jgi:hypothetical protein